MSPATASPRLVLALVLVLALFSPAGARCSSSQIECRTGGRCIYKYYVCDGQRDCSDNSDEDNTLCKIWPPKSSNCLYSGRQYRFYYSGSCKTVYDMCQSTGMSNTLDSRICQIVNQRKLQPLQQGMNADGKCSSSEIECRTGGSCIYKGLICDGSNDCSDGSDEDTTICKPWPTKSSSCNNAHRSNRFYTAGTCHNVYDMCRDSGRASTLDSKVCQTVNRPKLEPLQEEMNITNEVVAVLSAAVNSTLDHKRPDCPMLYTRVGNYCLSFFSAAKVPWPEARHFCRSIYGDLWQFTDFASFGQLMAFMREEQFTSDYWIGGRFDLDTNAWSWTTDDSVMPLGAPFWTLKQGGSCVARGPPHTDPYSDPPAATPGARCYRNVLCPSKRSSGWCAAMTYKNYYYWSDETCEESFSPLCVFTGPAATQEANN